MFQKFINFVILLIFLIIPFAYNSYLNEIYENDEQKLIFEIQSDILLKNYIAADQNIIKLGINNIKLILLIKDLYIKNINNFYLINDYARKTNQSEITFHVISALWNSMVDKKKIEFEKFCDFYKTFYDKIIKLNQTNHNDLIDTKEFVNYFFQKNMERKIKKFSIQKLKETFLSKKFSYFKDLIDKIYDTNELLYHKIIRKFIKNMYLNVNFRELISILWTKQNNLSQKGISLSAIFWILYKNNYQNNYFNDNQILILTYYLMKLQNFNNYSSHLSEFALEKITNFTEFIPNSIKNLYLSKEKICFRSIRYDHLIFANKSYDKWKHEMKTLKRNEINDGSKWLAKNIDEMKFKFENFKYKKEYLFSGDNLLKRNKIWHKVFTWVVNDDYQGSDIIWKIEIHQNQLKFINYYSGEALCSVFWRDLHFGEALTVKLISNYDPRCHWTIESC